MSEPTDPIRFTIPHPQGTLAGWRWPHTERPPLLFCHATGMCASAYRQMLRVLSDDFDVWALDMRGHGRTQLPTDPSNLRNWRPYAEDTVFFLNHAAATSQEPWVIAGHSMGAVSALMAVASSPGMRARVSRLALIEPVIIPRLIALAAASPFWPMMKGVVPLVTSAAKRRDHWPNRDAARQTYDRKQFFSAWGEGVLDDYLTDGLQDSGDSARLSCAPAWEAATFAAQANNFWKAAKSCSAPVAIMAADHRSSTVGKARHGRIRKIFGSIRFANGVSHLIPMENPSLAAQFIARSG